jgi:hypothetical protein
MTSRERENNQGKKKTNMCTGLIDQREGEDVLQEKEII